jgi:hypothetical protein
MSQVARAASGTQCISNTVLNRREASSRLHQLSPETEEYKKLQQALTKTSGIVEITLRELAYKVDASSEDYVVLGGFGPSEHMSIGQGVTLEGLDNDTALIERGSTKVKFEHIVALAGDYYGIAGQAISLPSKNADDRIERFIKAFETLEKADPKELQNIIKEIEQEYHAVRHSSLPHHCYGEQLMEHMEKIGKIKKDFGDLLADNSDHFSEEAKQAYLAGHTYALQVAREAGREQDPNKKLAGFKRACAIDAFACHFLTDLFAAGHIRNERGKLELVLNKLYNSSPLNRIIPEQLIKLLAGVLTGAQHEKDGKDGLNVKNAKDEKKWRAYGDGRFFSPQNEENKKKAHDAVNQSVLEVYHAYKQEARPSTIQQLLPKATPDNLTPLYTCNGETLFLHYDGRNVEIKTLQGYLAEAIPLALRYLPEDYVFGMILSKTQSAIRSTVLKKIGLENITVPIYIQTPVQKLIILYGDQVVEHLVGRFLHLDLKGVISQYQEKYQARKESRKLHEKLDGVADTGWATYHKTSEIQQQTQHLTEQVDQLVWDSLTEEIRESVTIIHNNLLQFQAHAIENMGAKQLETAEDELWSAYKALAGVFTTGSKLVAYEEKLKASKQNMTPKEIKINVTWWFRQMLEYQSQAFGWYSALRLGKGRGEEAQVQAQVSEFKIRLSKQVEANKDHIDISLIGESLSYVHQQKENSRIKRIASEQLKPFT